MLQMVLAITLEGQRTAFHPQCHLFADTALLPLIVHVGNNLVGQTDHLFLFFTSFSCLFVRLFANDGLQQRHVHLQTGIILLVPLDDGRDMQQCIEEIAGSGQLEDYSVFRLFCARST